ncbi:MAG: TIGR02757 family protein [Muribaculaceae bacterium]|nr:TIGR02757 family protein [Muribaculaceae bacterium]
MDKPDIRELLDYHASRINSHEFIADDPVQFPRMFTDQRDVEIAALLSATIAWGKRSMIIRDAQRMFSLMDMQPYNYVMDQGYEDLPQQNIHRTFFSGNLQHWMRGLRSIYLEHATLDDFSRSVGAGACDYPAVRIAEAINERLAAANGGIGDSRCLPLNLKTTALKRLNMALRWLVRTDGIVDLGLWRSIDESQLRIPLDVHVIRTATGLGLLTRRSADRKAVEELTSELRTMRPHDPVFYDFALFGLGVSGEKF